MEMRKLILISLLCFGGMAAKAQIPQLDPDTTAKHFLIVASIGNLQEVSSGGLAAQKGIRPEVKAFGKMMVKDHQDAESKLLALAKRKGYDLPAAATDGIQPDLNLKSADGNFYKLYVHAMVAGHNNTVQTFENYATTGKDPGCQSFCAANAADIKASSGGDQGD
jgi:putative membrane protein